jgi:hypothetical protein
MTTNLEDHNAASAQAEHIALDRIIDRLTRQFPDQTAEDITRDVHNEHARYAHSRVRNYLSILIESSIRARLTNKAARPR